MSWTRGQVLALLKVYQLHPCLFNVHKAVYFTFEERQRKLHDICEQLRPQKPDITVDLIQDQIGRLRKQYLQQRRLVKEAQKNGAEYKPELWCFNRLRFFDEICNDSDDGDQVINLDTDDSNGSGKENQGSGRKSNELKRKRSGHLNENGVEPSNNGEPDFPRPHKRIRGNWCEVENESENITSNTTHHGDNNIIKDDNGPNYSGDGMDIDEGGASHNGYSGNDQNYGRFGLNYTRNNPGCSESDISSNGEGQEEICYDGDEEDATRKSDHMPRPLSGLIEPRIEKFIEELEINREYDVSPVDHHSSRIEFKATVDHLRDKYLEEASTNLDICVTELYLKEYYILTGVVSIQKNVESNAFETWCEIQFLFGNCTSQFANIKAEQYSPHKEMPLGNNLGPSTSRQECTSVATEQINCNERSPETASCSRDLWRSDGIQSKEILGSPVGDYSITDSNPSVNLSIFGINSYSVEGASVKSDEPISSAEPENSSQDSSASNPGENQQISSTPSESSDSDNPLLHEVPAENRQVFGRRHHIQPGNNHHHNDIAEPQQPPNVNADPDRIGNEDLIYDAYNRFIIEDGAAEARAAAARNPAQRIRPHPWLRDQYWSEDEESSDEDEPPVSTDSGQGDDLEDAEENVEGV